MNALERYLRRATSGVWGKKRLELIAELRGSIEARIWMLECQGFAPERALEAALTELGEPRAIAAGLIGVHTMPKIFRSTLALGLFAVLSVTLINSSHAQIEVAVMGMRVSTEPTNIVSGPPARYANYLLNFQSIKMNLEAAGINVEESEPQQMLSAGVMQPVPMLTFTFPGSAKQTVLRVDPLVWRHQDGNLVWGSAVQPPTSSDTSAYYLPFWSFIQQLQKRTDLPIELIGWRDLKLKIGSTELRIGSGRIPVSPWEIYFSVAGNAVANALPHVKRWSWMYSSDAQRFGIRTDTAIGTVYAVMTTTDDSSRLHADAARVADDGVLYFDAPHKVLEFVKTPLELVKDRANISKRGYGSSSRPAKALLIRITPDLKTSFVLPARVRSGALK